MKDHWINIGFEEDELRPYTEPPPDINDPVRLGKWCIIVCDMSVPLDWDVCCHTETLLCCKPLMIFMWH